MTTAPTLPLYEAGIQHARNELKGRERALKAMKASLTLLDQHMPELRARGVEPHVAQINWNAFGRSLSIATALTSESRKLLAALLAIGFEETERNDYGSHAHIRLKNGRLKVSLCVWAEKGAA